MDEKQLIEFAKKNKLIGIPAHMMPSFHHSQTKAADEKLKAAQHAFAEIYTFYRDRKTALSLPMMHTERQRLEREVEELFTRVEAAMEEMKAAQKTFSEACGGGPIC